MALGDRTRAFLDEVRFTTLATVNPDGSPLQMVLWYRRDGDRIVLSTSRGTAKDRNIRRDGRVSLCIEDGYRYVALKGRVTINDDQAAATDDLRATAARYLGPEGAEGFLASQGAGGERVSYYLDDYAVTEWGFDGQPG